MEKQTQVSKSYLLVKLFLFFNISCFLNKLIYHSKKASPVFSFFFSFQEWVADISINTVGIFPSEHEISKQKTTTWVLGGSKGMGLFTCRLLFDDCFSPQNKDNQNKEVSYLFKIITHKVWKWRK